jgi:hypothetical protein
MKGLVDKSMGIVTLIPEALSRICVCYESIKRELIYYYIIIIIFDLYLSMLVVYYKSKARAKELCCLL